MEVDSVLRIQRFLSATKRAERSDVHTPTPLCGAWLEQTHLTEGAAGDGTPALSSFR
jgi:hypothetical protein